MDKESLDSFMQEVAQEAKADALMAHWQKWRGHFLAVCLAAIVLAMSLSLWRQHQDNNLKDESKAYLDSLNLVAEDKAAAAQKLLTLATSGHTAYRDFATLKWVNLSDDAYDPKMTQLLQDHLSSEKSKEAAEFAAYLYVMKHIDDGDVKALNQLLEPLMVKDSPWQAGALELSALMDIRGQDNVSARTKLTQITTMTEVNGNIQKRATQILSSLPQDTSIEPVKN